jgi:2-methylisocitrate lyase-like PEP mutase family enzyme
MPTQADKARAFAAMHKPGNPIVIYNIWDAGSAKTIEAAGAPALATGSSPVATAMGYADGEIIPLETVLMNVRRIVDCVSVPLSVDFEGGYAVDAATITANTRRLIEAGAIGVNFEDQVVGGSDLHSISAQAARVAAVVAAGTAAGVPLFVNARTDLFLKAPADQHATHLAEAIERAQAYAKAGASGFFAPGLTDPALISALIATTTLPVNLMMSPSAPPAATLSALGAARLSHGPFPWRAQMVALTAGYLAATAHQGKPA